MSGMMRVCLVGVVALLAFAAIGERSRQPNGTPTAEAATSPTPVVTRRQRPGDLATRESLQASIDLLQRQRRHHAEILDRYVVGSAEGEHIVQFYRRHAVYSLLKGHEMGAPGATQIILSREERERGLGQHPQDFEITVADFAVRRLNGVGLAAQWNFSRDRNELFAPSENGYTPLWEAAVLGHELRHAYDHAMQIEPPNSAGRAFLEGEVRAYLLELEILDRATNGAYSRELDAILAERPSTSTGWLVTIPDAAIERLHRLFDPPRTEDERATRLGSFLILINFRLIEREHLPPSARAEAVQTVMASTNGP
jgi:hypothetical protein